MSNGNNGTDSDGDLIPDELDAQPNNPLIGNVTKGSRFFDFDLQRVPPDLISGRTAYRCQGSYVDSDVGYFGLYDIGKIFVNEHGNMDIDQATEFVETQMMKTEKRYLRDVY